MKSLVAGVPRLRCLSLVILALAAGCQADGPELVTTSSGEVYLLKDGVLFHVQGDEATRVLENTRSDQPPSEILKEFSDTISAYALQVRTDLKLKYFGPSDVRYQLRLAKMDNEGISDEIRDCWREAAPFLSFVLEDVDGFRMGTVRLSAFSEVETILGLPAFLFRIPRAMEGEPARRPPLPPLGETGGFVAARGVLGLSAGEFERIAQASTRGPPICP